MNLIKNFKELEGEVKKNLVLILASYFFILFTYPIIRSLATSYFLEAYGAKDTPLSWLYSIGLLTITIFFMNKYLAKVGVQRIFGIVSLITIGALILPWLNQIKILSFFFFIWKEVYIVVLIHSFLAYTNSYFGLEDFKNWLGPIAAIGSLGGIIGGFTLSAFVATHGLDFAFVLATIGLVMPAVLFHFCRSIHLEEKEKPRHPLKAIEGIGSYVLIIAALVTLSQFVINIADFKFHIIFEQDITTKIGRTEFLGTLYGTINAVSLVAQFFIMPYLMKHFKPYSIHLFLPISYMTMGAFGFVGAGAIGAATTFVYYKGADYSFFSMGKELLYHPLANIQKFGAKYINDMFVYRFAKALVALMLVWIQKPAWVDSFLALFLVLWFLTALKLKSEYIKVKGSPHE